MPMFDPASASRAVLIEVVNVLGAFREQMVLVGVSIPDLLFPNKGHMGTLDVDLAVSIMARAGNAYETIRKRLVDAGYWMESEPTRFFRSVPGVENPVKVDFICGQYQEGGKTTSILVDEIRIGSVRGVDLAFEAADEILIAGHMPDGAHNLVRVCVVRPEAFILIKAFALDERKKQKDAYDIAFVLHHFEPSLAVLAERIRPHVSKGLGLEAYEILKTKFASINSVGPIWAAETAAPTGTGFEFEQRAAFEDAQELFRLVGE